MNLKTLNQNFRPTILINITGKNIQTMLFSLNNNFQKTQKNDKLENNLYFFLLFICAFLSLLIRKNCKNTYDIKPKIN